MIHIEIKGVLQYERHSKGYHYYSYHFRACKTVQDHDLMNEASQYYNEAKSGELIQSITHPNFNNFKDLDLSHFKPSDFF